MAPQVIQLACTACGATSLQVFVHDKMVVLRCCRCGRHVATLEMSRNCRRQVRNQAKSGAKEAGP